MRPRRKRNKYRTKPINGFASTWESQVNDLLRTQLLPGERLLTQVPVKFQCGAKLIIDFAVEESGVITRYIEAKGAETAAYRLKVRLLRHEHPDVFAKLTVLKSERTLKHEARIKARAAENRALKKKGKAA